MSNGAIAVGIENWLLAQALRNVGLVDIVAGLCDRVVEAGVEISRVVLAWPTLHPLFNAETVTWTRDGGVGLDQHPHSVIESEAWLASPMRHILVNQIGTLRCRLSGPDARRDFPLLVELAENGATDYVATTVRFDIPQVRADEDRGGMIITWATDRDGGFSDGDLALLQGINRGLAIACRSALLSRIATNIADTYLGRRAGTEVLAGKIRRGDGRTIRAVIWYSDLRDSTALGERLPPDVFLALLNRYFECTAGAVTERGGEVLDFIGDAVLAVFPIADGDERGATMAAIAAADEALVRLETHNAEAAAEPLDFGVALAVGDVMFGNIGIPARLTFSVIGPTVNAVARIEKATKGIGAQILATGEIAALDPAGWRSVGRHPLAGVVEPIELFTRQPR